MSNEKQVAVQTDRAVRTTQEYSAEQVDLIKRQIAKGASDDELQLFMHLCKHTGLDPFARQIYAIQRKEWNPSKGAMDTKMSFQVSIDGLRLVAERSDRYQGQVGPLWCGDDGKWMDVWLSQEYPRAAKVGVWKAGFKEPLYAVAHWDEYVQQFKDKETGEVKASKMWNEKPALMLAKCAESLALRKAFPQELSGLYTAEELSKSEKEVTPMAPEPTPVLTQPKPVAPQPPLVVGNLEREALKALLVKRLWTPTDAQAIMVTRWQKTLVTDLTRAQYDELVKHISQTPPPAKAEDDVDMFPGGPR